jgi:PelA/Pel-15E family pectate lyase
MKHHRVIGLALALASGLHIVCTDAGEPTPADQAREALHQAISFFHDHVAVRGTYLWQYSEDLGKREGEGKATSTQGWVQPPGTPAVGLAILDAWKATGEQIYLSAARETAYALAWGQLQSGGWTYFIDFDPESRRPLAYRRMDTPPRRARNVTSLDDDTTQSAIRFLVAVDQALQFKDPRIHDCARYALENLLAAQYPNGAWPQGFREQPDLSQHPVKPADYPESWSRSAIGADYWRYYTLNDNVLADTIRTLFSASAVYRSPAATADMNELAEHCWQAALKGADFILLAQMPEPQSAWAQQYNFDMHPAWARKFEPPAISGSESQRILETLMEVYRRTGQPQYLEPIPRALAWFQRSRRADGRLARFYELRTNRPLYFTRDYQLTYDDGDVPTHYAFTVPDRTPAIRRQFDELRRHPPETAPAPELPPASPPSEQSIRTLITAQDERGRWVENARLRYHGSDDPTTRVIRSATFIRNVRLLSRYLARPSSSSP